MTIIQFTPAFELRTNAINKLVNKEVCIELKIPAEEISYWFHFLSHSAHSTGYLLQKETTQKTYKLLQKDYKVLNDLQMKVLMFAGCEEDIHFNFSFEEVIIVEAQLEKFLEECIYFDDEQFTNITQKYLNTFCGVMEAQAIEFDYMVKYMLKDVEK